MRVAELGVAEGYFSRDMLNWGLEDLYCVDAWEHMPLAKGDGHNLQEWHDQNLDATFKRLEGFAGVVHFLRGKTHSMASEVPDLSLGLLYLDADHSYEGVMQDLEYWYGKVVPGGIIAGHDYLSPQYGVKRAVNDFCRGRNTVFTIEEDKPEDAGFWFQKSYNV